VPPTPLAGGVAPCCVEWRPVEGRVDGLTAPVPFAPHQINAAPGHDNERAESAQQDGKGWEGDQ